MKVVKRELIQRNGTVCMYCGVDVGKKITWHHIIPKYAKGKDNYENGSLLCEKCHRLIHKYNYKTKEYTAMTNVILRNKR